MVKSCKKRDSYSELADALSSINVKYSIYIFFIFIILTSSTFVDRVLSKFSDAVVLHTPTNYGTMIQGLCFALIYILVDVAIKNDVL